MKKIYLVDVAVAEAIMAKSLVGSYTRGDGTFVAAHDDKRQAAAPKPAAGRGKAAAPLHHSHLKEGDELTGPDGEKHEYSHTERGLGRMMIHTRAGHSYPTDKNGELPGWKKTGRNNMTGEGHKPFGQK